MYLNRKYIIKHIGKYAATGQIHDDLVPFYDQHGKWHGAPFIWFHIRTVPRLNIIKSSYLPASRRTLKERQGTMLRTSFIWRGDENVRMTYTRIGGSMIVEGNAIVHAACLRDVGGSLISSTNKRVYLPNLRTVGNHFQMMKTFDLKITRLRQVGGSAKMLGQFPPQLKTVGGSLGVYWCFTAESKSLKQIGGYMVLTKAESIRFPVLESIGGSLLLTLLVKSIDVPKLQSIGGDFFAPCASHICARALRVIGGKVDTSSAKGVYHPRIQVGGEWKTYPGDLEQWARNEAARRALKQPDILL